MASPPSPSTQELNDTFNFRTLHDGFASCLEAADDVDLDGYLLAYKELYKFFQLMGTIFSFVGSDVKTKIEILEEIRTKDTSGNMKTIKQLILYELQEDLLKKKDYVSGSRTLLRLHRGLDFISLFLQRVSEVDHKEGTANVCQEAYNLTLAQHHTWIIRKTAVVAMYALPTKEGLLHKVCGADPAEIQRAIDILPKMLEASREVHGRTQRLFEEHCLLDLP